MESVRPAAVSMPARAPTWVLSSLLPKATKNWIGVIARGVFPESGSVVALLGSMLLHVGVVLGSLYVGPAATVPEPLPPVEFEIDVAAQIEEPPPPAAEEPPPPEPVVVEPPKPKVKAVVKPKPPDEQPVKQEKEVAEDARPASEVAAAPTVTPDQAAPDACATGVCLATGTGGGIGKVGSEGTGRVGAPAPVSTAPAPTPAESSLGRPLKRVRPAYPARAAEHNIEGWVLLRFKVGKDGEVLNPEVVEASHAHLFNTAAIDAIKQWKYQPMIVAGVRTVREGVLVRLSFKLD